MKLLISLTSPYARAARIAVSVLELQGQVDVQTVNHRGFDERLLKQNPLGKVPTLILQDEAVLFDSRVIVSHLYEQAGRAAELHRGPEKFRGATRQALATGVMDCTIAAAVEKRNHAPDCQNSAWIDRQEGKLRRVLGFLAETGLSSDFIPIPSADDIFLACALGYLDFILPEIWKDADPALQQWLRDFSDHVPAFEETRPQN